MTLNVQGLIIDPQVDFMDLPNSSLPVPGANADMDRLAAMVDRVGHKFADVHVTLDSHHKVDVGHPAMWRSADGKAPAPFTAILADDIRAGIWTPRNAQVKLAALDGRTIRDYMIYYAETLEAQGSYVIMVWPEHCLIGSPGHAVQENLRNSLNRWADREFANINFVTKGTNPWTEHYGAVQAEVPMPTDPSTGLNTDLLQVLETADIVFIAGEALSHCVKGSVSQVFDNIDEKLIRKFHLLTDCTSPIPAAPGGPDFPAIADAWVKEMVARGMVLTSSTDFLA